MKSVVRSLIVILIAMTFQMVGSDYQPESAFAQDGYGPITFENIDGNTGELLPGAVFNGESCTRFHNDPDWTCTSLNDYSCFRDGMTDPGSTFDHFANEIYMEGAFSDPVQHCVIVHATSAPEGYVYDASVLAVCKGVGGWTANHDIVINDQQLGTGSWIGTADENGDIVGWSLPNFPVIPPQPEPVITYGEWSTEAATCDARTVQQTRTVYQTEYVLNDANTWVLGEPVVTGTETRSATLTDAEIAACDAKPTAPSGDPTAPAVDPTMSPTTPVTDTSTAPASTQESAATTPTPTPAAVTGLPSTGNGGGSALSLWLITGTLVLGGLAATLRGTRLKA